MILGFDNVIDGDHAYDDEGRIFSAAGSECSSNDDGDDEGDNVGNEKRNSNNEENIEPYSL